MHEQTPPPPSPGASKPVSPLRNWLGSHVFTRKHEIEQLKDRLAQQEDQIRLLHASVEMGPVRSSHLALLKEITQALESILDRPVSAQLVVNAIQSVFANELVAIYSYENEKEEFSVLAVAGDSRRFPPPGYHQPLNEGLMGRAVKARKSIIARDLHNETTAEADDLPGIQSQVLVPLNRNGAQKGVLILDSTASDRFDPLDVAALEIVADQLANAWERAAYNQRFTDQIQAGITLSSSFDTSDLVRQIAETVVRSLEAQFAFVTLLDKAGNFTHTDHLGNAPLLLKALRNDPENDLLIQATLKSERVIRIRDIRNFDLTAHLKAAHAEHTNLLAFPLRSHQLAIGAVLAFGKAGETSFSDSDESLANLLAMQAGAAVENSRLYQELNSSLQTATLLYQLSIRVIQAEDLQRAAEAIVEATFNLGSALLAGIVLLSPDQQVQTKVTVDSDGKQVGSSYPSHLVNEAVRSGQTVVLAEDYGGCKICVPLQTSQQIYGALWLDFPERYAYTARYADSLQTLANQATIALERSILSVQTREQTQELKSTYEQLETTYDQTLFALTSALDARDHETEGHSKRVGEIARRLGKELGLNAKQLKALERGGLLHDIGKIGIGDRVLLKTGPLSSEEWQMMRLHPEIGARIVEKVPFLSDTMAIVRYHHERWDGSGYPIGLKGEEIPVLARIFAVADMFDALTSDRPYRKKVSRAEAVEILHGESGKLQDPEVVSVFIRLLADGSIEDILQQTQAATPGTGQAR